MEEKNNGSKKNKKKQDNFLLYVPQKKHLHWEEKKGIVFLIFYHNKPIERFARWLVKKPNTSDIELDSLGSRVWLSIDGERTVYGIGEELKKTFGEKCEPVYDRLIMFLRYLNRRGWISFDRGNQEVNTEEYIESTEGDMPEIK